jgi:hypothetical protein
MIRKKRHAPRLGRHHLLHSLGRNNEALEKAKSVERGQKANPALGPSHPDTEASSHLIAEILHSLK